MKHQTPERKREENGKFTTNKKILVFLKICMERMKILCYNKKHESVRVVFFSVKTGLDLSFLIAMS